MISESSAIAPRPIAVIALALLAYGVISSLYEFSAVLGLPLALRNGVGITLFILINLIAPALYGWLYQREPRMGVRLLIAFSLPLCWVLRELVASYLVLGPGGLAIGLANLLYLEIQAVAVGVVDLVCRLRHRRSDPSVPLFGWHSLLLLVPLALTLAAWITAASLLG